MDRIAEFHDSDDAHAFMKAKNREAGEDVYTVCGGLHMMWAVMPKLSYQTGNGRDEPPESHYFEDDDYE